jgi:hypothetical protein
LYISVIKPLAICYIWAKLIGLRVVPLAVQCKVVWFSTFGDGEILTAKNKFSPSLYGRESFSRASKNGLITKMLKDFILKATLNYIGRFYWILTRVCNK